MYTHRRRYRAACAQAISNGSRTRCHTRYHTRSGMYGCFGSIATKFVSTGDEISIDLSEGVILNLDSKESVLLEYSIPYWLLDLITYDGLYGFLDKNKHDET